MRESDSRSLGSLLCCPLNFYQAAPSIVSLLAPGFDIAKAVLQRFSLCSDLYWKYDCLESFHLKLTTRMIYYILWSNPSGELISKV